MGKVIPMLGGSGNADSDELTAYRQHVLENYTAITHDTDGEPGTGTMPNLTAGSTVNHATGNATKVIVGDEAFISTNTDGVTRAEIRYNNKPGYIEGNTLLGVEQSKMANAIGLNSLKISAGNTVLGVQGDAWTVWTGDASAESGHVLPGKTYWRNGVKMTGNMAIQNADVSGSDRAYATNVSAWGGVICLGVRNGHYLNGVNWIQADIAGLQAANIREGINIGGLTGTLKDMSVNHVPFDGASFSGVLAKGAEICNWYNNNVLRNPVEITGDGLRMVYSTANLQFNKFCPKESITFSPFKTVRVSIKFNGSSRGKGHAALNVYRADTSRSNVLLNSSTGLLKYTTIGMDNPGTIYTGDLDVSAVNDEGFLAIYFTNAKDVNYTSYFITRIEFLT